jgi:hypothetical protein
MKRFLIILAIVFSLIYPSNSDAYMEIEGVEKVGSFRVSGYGTRLAISSQGFIYVKTTRQAGRSRSDTIYVFDQNGRRLKYFRLDCGKMISFTLDSNDYIYASCNEDRTVRKFTPDGKLLKKFYEPGEFTQPFNLTYVKELDHIFVHHMWNGISTAWTRDGTLMKTYDVQGKPHDVVYMGTRLYFVASSRWNSTSKVAGNGSINLDKIHIFDVEGNFYAYGGVLAAGQEGNLISIKGITKDIEGNIYVADSFQSIVFMYDGEGNYKGAIKVSEKRSPILHVRMDVDKTLYTMHSFKQKVNVHKVPWEAEPVPPESTATPNPNASFAINNGADYTTERKVTLNFDIPEATFLSISNDGYTWSIWQAYDPGVAWVLSDGDGEKVVYVQYQDKAGKLWSTFDQILLDTIPPDTPVVNVTPEGTISWSYSGEEATLVVMYADNPQFINPRYVDASAIGSFKSEPGTWYWKIKAIDSAGNSSFWSPTYEVYVEPPPPAYVDPCPVWGDVDKDEIVTDMDVKIVLLAYLQDRVKDKRFEFILNRWEIEDFDSEAYECLDVNKDDEVDVWDANAAMWEYPEVLYDRYLSRKVWRHAMKHMPKEDHRPLKKDLREMQKSLK